MTPILDKILADIEKGLGGKNPLSSKSALSSKPWSNERRWPLAAYGLTGLHRRARDLQAREAQADDEAASGNYRS
jgi:hypothetical protein